MTTKLNMKKFQRRADDARRKFEEEMAALAEAEEKEVARRVDPIVSKIARVVEEETRKILMESPEILEAFSFRKREATKELRDALDRLLVVDAGNTGDAEEDENDPSDDASMNRTSHADRKAAAGADDLLEDESDADESESSDGGESLS